MLTVGILNNELLTSDGSSPKKINSEPWKLIFLLHIKSPKKLIPSPDQAWALLKILSWILKKLSGWDEPGPGLGSDPLLQLNKSHKYLQCSIRYLSLGTASLQIECFFVQQYIVLFKWHYLNLCQILHFSFKS